ncbi:MAG: hypothetical protein ABUS79_27485 [Pseudomonadota bacterium]
MALAVLAWAAGCATAPAPAIEPAFAARTYTPIRIALLPPDVFVVVDQVGENDPARSEALRQAVFGQVVKFSTEAFRQRGYDLDLSARWDGIVGRDGQLLVSRDELGWMANGILQFANSPSGGKQGPLTSPEIIAPELAAKIGWATQSDALLYVNLKGVASSDGKRAAQIIGTVFIVVVVALIVLALLADSKGGGGGRGIGSPGGGAGRSVSAPTMRGVPGGAVRPGGMGAVVPRGPVPMGRGVRPGFVGGRGRVYGGGPHIGVGVMIPLGGPTYTHDGSVSHDDEVYGGDQMYLSMTLVNAADGRVLWHLRDDLDLDADDPKDVQELVERVVGAIPLRGDLVVQTPAAGKR